MGYLADYASSEIGQERMMRLRASGDACKTIVEHIYSTAVDYDNYRKSLDGDGEDEQFSDDSLTAMCDDLKPILDSMTTDQKKWVTLALRVTALDPRS